LPTDEGVFIAPDEAKSPAFQSAPKKRLHYRSGFITSLARIDGNFIGQNSPAQRFTAFLNTALRCALIFAALRQKKQGCYHCFVSVKN
jgi:hypothetical protein